MIKIYVNLRQTEMTPIPSIVTALPAPPRNTALYEAAQKLEATFLAEMLKSAGLGQTSESFGGGAGEDQFGSFLVQEQAMQMVRSGGIGLAESLYEALMEQNNGE